MVSEDIVSAKKSVCVEEKKKRDGRASSQMTAEDAFNAEGLGHAHLQVESGGLSDSERRSAGARALGRRRTLGLGSTASTQTPLPSKHTLRPGFRPYRTDLRIIHAGESSYLSAESESSARFCG